jgi:hypothetical protein
MSEKNIIERAFELARQGDCASLLEIRQTLARERYTSVDAHMAGLGIRSQLKALIRQASRNH